MFRPAPAFVLASTVRVAACPPITSYQGFQAVEANPKDVKVGVDSKTTVMDRLGSPSAVAAFDPNTWYYISQISDQVAFKHPEIKKRDITAISFNKADDKVAEVRMYALKDGKVIPFNKRITPTRGREMSVLEQ